MNTLDKICADKRDHIQTMKRATSLADLEAKARAASSPRGFRKALQARASVNKPALIAEIKKASPSGGLIRPDFDPAALARAYEESGASCLSVLTDTPWFHGRDEDLIAARSACVLPALRKDFILDVFQVTEARALGADCILLIMAALSDAQAAELHDAATAWGMDVLIEVHDRAELNRALALPAGMIGVNSRNLKTLIVDLNVALDLASAIPASVTAIAESGIRNNNDLRTMQKAGYSGFLVGESLMRQPDLKKAVHSLLDTNSELK